MDSFYFARLVFPSLEGDDPQPPTDDDDQQPPADDDQRFPADDNQPPPTDNNLPPRLPHPPPAPQDRFRSRHDQSVLSIDRDPIDHPNYPGPP